MAETALILEIRSGTAAGTRFRIADGTAVLGRSEDVDVSLPGENSLSRRHASISISDGRIVVSDLGSQNGTFLNNERIAEEVEIPDGAVLRLGKVEFLAQVEVPDNLPTAPESAEPAPVTADESEEQQGIALHEAAPLAEPGAAASGLSTTDDDQLAELSVDGIDVKAGRRFLGKVALLGAVILGVLYFISILSNVEPAKQPPTYIIRVNETIVIRLKPESKGYDEVEILPKDFSILEWDHFNGMIGTMNAIVVTGLNHQDATVRIKRDGSVTETFNVLVRGVIPREYELRNLPIPEALRLARQKQAQGDELAEEYPYHAIQRYEESEELFQHARRPREAAAVAQKSSAMRDALQEKVRKHYQRAVEMIKPDGNGQRDLVGAVKELRAIKDLVPDEQSIDYQFVNTVEQLVISLLRARQ